MSVRATTWVWDHSESAGNARLVLLAIADAADQHGGNAWPSQVTLAAMCRLSVRTVRRMVSDLVDLGELEVIEHGGPAYRDDRRPNRYRLPKMQVGTGGQNDLPSRTGGQLAPNGRTAQADGRTLLAAYPSFLDPPRTEHPSGGSLREPDPTSTEEDNMPPAPTHTLPLDLELPEPGRPAPKPRTPSAADVVAAYVDSFRQHHSGGNPLKSEIGRVSRDAKALIVGGRATVDELVTAATAMGSGPFCNLGVQLNIARDRRTGTRGAVPASGREVFQEASDSAEADFVARLHVDEELASWVAEDPEAVRRYVAMDATLESVFARLTAA